MPRRLGPAARELRLGVNRGTRALTAITLLGVLLCLAGVAVAPVAADPPTPDPAFLSGVPGKASAALRHRMSGTSTTTARGTAPPASASASPTARSQ